MDCGLSFGSVGDIIALCFLIKDFVKALDDSRGSSKEYRDLIRSLENLTQLLQKVEQIYQDPRSADALDDLSTIAASSIDQVRQRLTEFYEEIRKYRPSLESGGSGNVLKDITRKIQWRLKKEVEKFRAELAKSIALLDVLSSLAMVRITQKNHDSLVQQQAGMEGRITTRMQQAAQAIQGGLDILGRRIISNLGFLSKLTLDLKSSTSRIISLMVTVSMDLSSIKAAIMRLDRVHDEHFLFEDATGRLFPIHLKTITSWEAFEFILNDRFKGKKGANRIRRNLYSLHEETTHREVDRNIDWDSAFRPQQRVNMSMICKESTREFGTEPPSICPSCGTATESGAGIEVQCQNCGMFFTRVVETDQYEPLLQASLAFRHDTHAEVGDASSPNSADDHRHSSARPNPDTDSDDEDVRGFKRITLIAKRRRTALSTRRFHGLSLGSPEGDLTDYPFAKYAWESWKKHSRVESHVNKPK